MGSIFSYDGPLVTFCTKIANMMLVSLMWVVCCIPVVTMIPASAAMFHTTTKIIRGRGSGIFRDFVRTFISNLKMGVILNLIVLASGFVLFTCVDFGRQMEGIFGLVYMLIGMVLMLFWAMMILYLPPVLSRFEGKVTMYIRMALFLSSQRMVRSLGMLVLLFVVAFLTDYFPMVLMITPGLFADMTCTGMEKALSLFDNSRQEDTAGEQAADDTEDSMSALSMDRQLDED